MLSLFQGWTEIEQFVEQRPDMLTATATTWIRAVWTRTQNFTEHRASGLELQVPMASNYVTRTQAETVMLQEDSCEIGPRHGTQDTSTMRLPLGMNARSTCFRQPRYIVDLEVQSKIPAKDRCLKLDGLLDAYHMSTCIFSLSPPGARKVIPSVD